jgi:hypothetical protein
MILVREMPKEKVVFIGLHYEGPPKSKYKLDGTPFEAPSMRALFSWDPFWDQLLASYWTPSKKAIGRKKKVPPPKSEALLAIPDWASNANGDLGALFPLTASHVCENLPRWQYFPRLLLADLDNHVKVPHPQIPQKKKLIMQILV